MLPPRSVVPANDESGDDDEGTHVHCSTTKVGDATGLGITQFPDGFITYGCSNGFAGGAFLLGCGGGGGPFG